jgi:amino acid transporter
MDQKYQPSLDQHALGLGDSAIMGIAGTAPAFSVAATMATLAGAVGILAPASLLYCGIAMFGTAFAFLYLSRSRPDAGASYAWVGQAFHPVLGFFAGWAVLVSSSVFMVAGTIPAATATLALVAPGMTDNTNATTVVAAGWMLLVSAIVLKGIKLSSYFQIAMTLVEAVILLAVIVGAIVIYAGQPAHPFGLADLAGQGFTPGLFATGALTALFFYWGWDVTANLNEETRDASRNQGRAAFIAMVFIMAVFVAFAIAALMALSDQEIQDAGTNVVLAVAEKLVPKPWSYAAVICVMLSTVGTLETNILQFTRTLFAMARGGSFNPRYARLHAKNQTPWVATITVTVLGLILLVLSSYLPSINTVVKDSVSAVGLQVAFYYGLTCFAAAWTMQRKLSSPLPEGEGKLWIMLTGIAWPVLSGLFLFAIAAFSLPTFDTTTTIVGLGGLAIGIVPIALSGLKTRAVPDVLN